ncbi:MAG: hypothetical protein QOI11_1768 [Candidatus Eremiobacteraeota bacterium]|jgi:hypothetical protein|nr:hypothetical protein [Candidatus Eremiobacteraeota bacterium]
MELRHREEITEVSRYWTPEHLDVTHVPLTYARPRASWVEGYQRLRPLLAIDTHDRLARHRMSSHAVVDPTEITVLPPLAAAVPARRERTHRSFLDGVRAVARRRVTG